MSTLTHPSKELYIATVLMAPVNDVGDKFGSAPAGLGFRRRGASERRNGTKRQGRPYHARTCVIRVVYAKYSPTLSVRSLGIDFSLSLSLSSLHALLARNGREYCEELGHTIVLGLPRVHPNTSKQRVAHCYPLQGSGEHCGR